MGVRPQGRIYIFGGHLSDIMSPLLFEQFKQKKYYNKKFFGAPSNTKSSFHCLFQYY